MSTTSSTKERVKNAIEEAVRNCNRNIYEWRVGNKREKFFTMSYTEMHGLAKNWLVRTLRDVLGMIDASRIFRDGLCIHMDESEYCISRISLSSIDSWRGLHEKVEMVSNIMKEINYESLRYRHFDFAQDGKYHRNYDNPSYIDLSSIDKITF
jgi:hypothetical protein